MTPFRTRGADPEHEVLLADSVGWRSWWSPAAARRPVSRARRRVQGQAPAPDSDLTRQREVVNAFFAAARNGDLDALVAVLDPDAASGGPTAASRMHATRSRSAAHGRWPSKR
ncbi:MAG: hypothetical protein ACRDQ7_24780 [Haloechinothrix sp.]